MNENNSDLESARFIGIGILAIMANATYLLLVYWARNWPSYYLGVEVPYFSVSLGIGVLGFIAIAVLLKNRRWGPILTIIFGVTSLTTQLYWLIKIEPYFLMLLSIPSVLILGCGIVALILHLRQRSDAKFE